MKKNLQGKKDPTPKFSLTFDAVVEIILLIFIFLTPVIFDRRLGIVFSGTKIAWMRAFMTVAISLWAVKLIILREHRFIRTPLDWPIMTFLLTTTIAALASLHTYTSVAGFYGRYEGLSTWYIYGLLFFVTTNFIHSLEQIKRVVAVIIPAGVIMSIYSILQRHVMDPYMWGGVVTKDRVIGTIGQPNFIAAYVVMVFFLCLILFLEEKKWEPKVDWPRQLLPLGSFVFSQAAFLIMIYTLDTQDVFVWYLYFTLITVSAVLFAFSFQRLHSLVLDSLLVMGILLTFTCQLYTQSRGGYMGFFTGASLFAVLAGRELIFKNWRKLMLIGFLIALVTGITMLNPAYSPIERFTAEIGMKKEIKEKSDAANRLELKGAAGSRGETWKSAFKVYADNPLFGVGPEVLKMVFPRYETDLFRFKEAFHVKQDRCHNEIFDVSVSKGLITFFVYLWLLFTLFKTGIAKLKTSTETERILLAGLLAAALSYLIQNQFSFGVVAITTLFWTIWGLTMKTANGEKQFSGNSRLRPGKLHIGDIPWLPVALVVLTAGAIIYISFLSFRGDIFLKTGKVYSDMRQFPKAIEEFNDAMAVFPLEGMNSANLSIAYLNSGQADKALEMLNYGTKIDPYNADNFHILGRVYLSQNNLAETRRNAEITIKIDPYYAEAYQTLGYVFEREGKRKEAAEKFRRTFMINPNLSDAMRDLERVTSPQEARQAFEAAYKKYSDNIVVLEKISRIYLDKKEYNEAAETAERMVEIDPKNAAGYLLKGEAEINRKNTDSAFTAFQQAILLDPKSVPGHNGLALAYFKLGNKERAKEELETVLALEPNNDFAKRMAAGLK